LRGGRDVEDSGCCTFGVDDAFLTLEDIRGYEDAIFLAEDDEECGCPPDEDDAYDDIAANREEDSNA
jgi:hypothetical protein